MKTAYMQRKEFWLAHDLCSKLKETRQNEGISEATQVRKALYEYFSEKKQWLEKDRIYWGKAKDYKTQLSQPDIILKLTHMVGSFYPITSRSQVREESSSQRAIVLEISPMLTMRETVRTRNTIRSNLRFMYDTTDDSNKPKSVGGLNWKSSDSSEK